MGQNMSKLKLIFSFHFGGISIPNAFPEGKFTEWVERFKLHFYKQYFSEQMSIFDSCFNKWPHEWLKTKIYPMFLENQKPEMGLIGLKLRGLQSCSLSRHSRGELTPFPISLFSGYLPFLSHGPFPPSKPTAQSLKMSPRIQFFVLPLPCTEYHCDSSSPIRIIEANLLISRSRISSLIPSASWIPLAL